MLKLKFQFDEGKIIRENIYDLDVMYESIEDYISQYGFKLQDEDGAKIIIDNGTDQDFGYFGCIILELKDSKWFMANATLWLLLDSDNSDNPDDFDEEDLLEHYRNKQKLEA